MKQHKHTRERIRLTVLSAVHIGNGNRLRAGLDFIATGQSTYVVPLSVIEAAYRDDFRIRQQIDQGKVPLNAIIQRNDPRIQHYSTKCTAQEILEFQKHPDHRPYIPGSSIKGAVRTAVLAQLFSRGKYRDLLQLVVKSKKKKKKEAARQLEQRLLTIPEEKYPSGANAQNRDLFRTLIVDDAVFHPEDLDLYPVRVATLRGGQARWQGGITIYPEILVPDASAVLTMRLDPQIGSGKGFRLFREGFPTSMDELFKLLNRHAQEMVKLESALLARYRSLLEDGFFRAYLEDVVKQIPSPTDTRRCALRIGWGSGWDSITGAIAKSDKQQFETIRQRYRLGGKDPIFPKTHKIVLNHHNKPVTVLGWVLLERLDKK